MNDNFLNWANSPTRKITEQDYLLNGIITEKVRGSILRDTEMSLYPTVIDRKKTDHFQPEPNVPVTLDLPIFNNDIRIGQNTRTNKQIYTPNSKLELPKFN